MTNLLPVKLMKMSGAGNTFVLIDAREQSAWQGLEKTIQLSRPQIVKAICDHVKGVGADGALFIESPSTGFDFNWDFYNSDGSTAEMCGNVSRCAARYCQQALGSSDSDKIVFKTGAGPVATRVLKDGRVEVKMPEARWLQQDLELKTKSGMTESFMWVDTGVPHAVKKVDSFEDVFHLKDLAEEVRSHEALGSKGANVTFYTETLTGEIRAISFERGVENYTLACGTGAVAAALVYRRENPVPLIQVVMPGGTLVVEFKKDDPCPVMTGEAVFVCEFEPSFEVLK